MSEPRRTGQVHLNAFRKLPGEYLTASGHGG